MFPDLCGTAIKRFESLKWKLEAKSNLHVLYNDFIVNYLSLEHIPVVTSPGNYLIPHRIICKGYNGGVKIRVVFDALARCFTGLSLNSAIHPWLKLKKYIVDIYIRFCMFHYVFTTDICKIYWQILIIPEFRLYQHIFWHSSLYAELVKYELNIITYGINSAPLLAVRVL